MGSCGQTRVAAGKEELRVINTEFNSQLSQHRDQEKLRLRSSAMEPMVTRSDSRFLALNNGQRIKADSLYRFKSVYLPGINSSKHPEG